MSKNYYHYPIWVRLWHLVNAVLCIMLIVTGLQIALTDPSADAAISYQSKVSIHNVSGILLTISYLGFFLGNLFTGNGKHYRKRLKGSRERLWKQVRYSFSGRFKGEEAPFQVDGENKFEPLQKASYIGAMYLVVPLLIVSGWILMNPIFFMNLPPWLNIYESTDILHIVLAVIISLFLLVHLAISIANRSLKSIISGWTEGR